MAEIQHNALTGAQLHEPKGVSAASSGDWNFAASGANGWASAVFTDNDTPSAVSTVEFTDLSDYRQLTLSFRELLHGTPARFWLQFSSDNGSSYHSDEYYVSYNQNVTSISDSTHTVMYIAQSATEYSNGTIVLSNFNQALPTVGIGMLSQSTTAGKTGTTNSYTILACRNSAVAYNAFKIATSTGTFTSGEITIEGIRS